jgi:hypothetical protein
MIRPPDETFKLIAQMQPLVGADFDLTDLVWGVIEDILDSIHLAETAAQADEHPDPGLVIHGTVLDYVSNYYGD